MVECSVLSSLHNSMGKMSGRVAAHWPSFMNEEPATWREATRILFQYFRRLGKKRNQLISTVGEKTTIMYMARNTK